MKYGCLFDSQSKTRTVETKKKRRRSWNETEREKNQSQTNTTFQNKNHVNNFNTNENTTSDQSDNNTVKNSLNERNCENLYHWGASREIMEIIRKKIKAWRPEDWWNGEKCWPDQGLSAEDTTHNPKDRLDIGTV